MFALECGWCGGIAFKFKQLPEFGDVVEAENVVLAGGRTPMYGEVMRCDCCDSIIINANLDPEFVVSVDN
jgi:hypothetical protein